MIGLILIRLLVESDFKIIHTPLDLPLLAFGGIGMLATFLAIGQSSLTLNESLGEVRTVFSYMTFFIVTNLVREKGQLRTLIKGLFLLATIVALATIAQFILGNSVRILPGRVETLGTQGMRFLEVTRVIPPGQSVMVVAFIAVFTTLVLQRTRLIDALKLLQCSLLGLAIVVTFFRASWIMIALTVLIIGFLANRQERQKLLLWVLGAILSVTVILMVVMEQPESRAASLARAAFARLGTLANVATYEDQSSSLRSRDFEYGYALPKILANPFVGLGLGARYRPLTLRDYETFDGRRFIHNGHVYILLKTGVFGYVGLLWFMLCVLVRGLRYWRHISEPYMRGIVLAFALTSLGVLIVSIVEPYVMTPGWTPVIGIIAGINEIVLCRFSPGPSVVR
jgi:O-antigen ligase